jgi:hypothetical protein
MMDWQSYEDGSMSEEQRKAADELLRTSEEARRELAGLQSFRKAVRQAALQERPPMDRLAAGLKQVTQQAPPRRVSWNAVRGFGLAAAACLALAAVFIFQNQASAPQPPVAVAEEAFDPSPTPALAQVQVRSAAQAAAFLREESGLKVPTVSLAGMASPEGAAYGKGWCCYDFKVDGQVVHIYIRPKDGSLGGKPAFDHKGMPMFRQGGIGWNCSGWTYFVSGAPDDVLRKVAGAVCDETRPQSTVL